MAATAATHRLLITHPETLLQIDYIRDLFMIPDRLSASSKINDTHFKVDTQSPLYIGKLMVWSDQFYRITQFIRTDNRSTDHPIYDVEAEPVFILYDQSESKPLFTPQEPLELPSGTLPNQIGSGSLKTTVGRFIVNYWLLVYPFHDKIPYINKEIKTRDIEALISDLLLKKEITVSDVKDKYINALSLFGQTNEIICPNITEKTITIPQSIHDLRTKLVNDNRKALEAGDVAVMTDIEQQLIKAYRAYLEGDPSLHFLIKKKYFDVTLKKLFLTQGTTEIFGQPGKFAFIDNPMGHGWKIKDLPTIFNEVRSGSYSRAIETADGGVIAKLILRVFQDTRIDLDDCGTTKGEIVTGTKSILSDFIHNYIVHSDGTTSELTADTLVDYIGQTVKIRTPGYCESQHGFCKKCFGSVFEKLGYNAFAPIANDFARTQTTSALKAMHGKSHNVVDVSDLNRWILTPA